jgi:hypothetical protein
VQSETKTARKESEEYQQRDKNQHDSALQPLGKMSVRFKYSMALSSRLMSS